jgi:hypothetical protein
MVKSVMYWWKDYELQETTCYDTNDREHVVLTRCRIGHSRHRNSHLINKKW